MPAPCKTIKYKKKRSNKPVVRPKRTHSSSFPSPTDDVYPIFYSGEGEYREPESIAEAKESTLELLRRWLEKQRFIPQDLSDEFLLFFLSAAEYVLESASEKLEKYFYARQQPSPLFRDRDPLSPNNVEIFKKLYVLPLPDTTDDGSKIIITGLLNFTLQYNHMEHAKALAMVLDLLIWEKEFGFGDFVVILDGRNFSCNQLLENTVRDHRSITSLLLDTIPGSLRSFYILYPPAHAKHVIENRNGIWFTVVRKKEEMLTYFPRDILPLEYGGNLGHLGDLLEQWQTHLAQSRDFFINFEKKMVTDYCRKECHERAVAEGGKNWIHRMKLEADESEYKTKYYERMEHFRPFKHPAFGPERLLHVRKRPARKDKDPMAECRKLVKEEEEKEKTFEPTNLYHGYAKEIREANRKAELERSEQCRRPVLELHVHYLR